MKTLLIADDELSLRLLVRATIALEQYALLEARDGDEAWARAIKDDEALAGTHVIRLTARSQARDIREGLAAGADLYLTKPFSPLALLAAINRAFGLEQMLGVSSYPP